MKRFYQLYKDTLKKGENLKRVVALVISAAIMTTFAFSVSAGSDIAPVSGNSAYDMRTSKRSSTTMASATEATTTSTTTTIATETTTTTTTRPTGAEVNENTVEDAVQTATELNEDGTPKISAGSAIVMDCDTGMVLYGVNQNQLNIFEKKGFLCRHGCDSPLKMGFIFDEKMNAVEVAFWHNNHLKQTGKIPVGLISL